MTDPHLDTSLRLVSDSRRREIIRRLRRETGGETRVADLVDQLIESGSAPPDGRPDRRHVSIQLIHNHLPRLDDHGVVDYDRENETVRYRPNERVEAVLDALSTEATQTASEPLD